MPRYNWNIVESGVKHNNHNLDPIIVLCTDKILPSYLFIGPPVVTNQSVSFDSENVTLSVYFHSNPGYHAPMWFYRKRNREYIIDMNTDQFSQDLLNSSVAIATYGVNVLISGYRASLNVMHSNLTNIVDFICQIRNEFGATEICTRCNITW